MGCDNGYFNVINIAYDAGVLKMQTILIIVGQQR